MLPGMSEIPINEPTHELTRRFGKQVTDEKEILMADQWVFNVGERLIPSVLTEFGVVELMVRRFPTGD
jgi:hypothetical protein